VEKSNKECYAGKKAGPALNWTLTPSLPSR